MDVLWCFELILVMIEHSRTLRNNLNTNLTCTDDYSEIEWKLELKKLKDKSSPMECHIIDGMVWEISDVELADLLHVSRQYINRKRRQLMQRLKDQI